MIEKTVGRPPQTAPAEASPRAPHAALLVDFDNVTMGIRSDLQTQLRKLLNSDIIRGKVSVQRAYADWRRYPQYIVPLTEASIDLIFAPAVGANKKNATDIRLAIDALELVFTRPEIGTFILLSGDSDFSGLVLKLKEYGKFVIGVGIRESSSDLLVQNCDEYYSYNELTGLARTGEVEVVRRDPWELAVEAIQKMLRDGDVMRSDRLKQVMQSIDPNFDEKDVGCNRFSKFVVEAEKRGLLELNRMENGQYAVDLGPNANVQEERVVPAESKPRTTETKKTTQQRKRAAPTSGDRDTATRTLTLSEGFDLLKRALTAIGAVGETATDADRVREQMIEIHGNGADPVFEPKRFVRMLRQAHDANVIELIKSGDDDYELKLSATATTDSEKADTAKQPEGREQQPAGEPPEDTEAEAKPKRSTRKTTARKSSRSRARAAAKDTADEETAPSAETGAETLDEEPEKPKRTERKKKTTKKKTAKSRAKKTEADIQDELSESAGELDAKDAAEEPVEATAKAEAEAADTEKEVDASGEEKPKRTAGKKTTTARKKATTTRKKTTSTRKKTTAARKSNGESTEKVAGEAPAENGESGPEEAEAKAETEPREMPKRDTSGEASANTARVRPKAAAPTAVLNPRFRKGSRSAAPKPPAEEGESTPKAGVEAAAPSTPELKAPTTPPRLGRRSGSRGTRRLEKHEQAAPAVQEGGQPGAQPDAADKESHRPEPRPDSESRESKPKPPTSESALRKPAAELPASESTSSPEEAKSPSTAAAANVTREHTKQDRPEDESQEDGMSLFRKVSAAFQRAMGTGRDER